MTLTGLGLHIFLFLPLFLWHFLDLDNCLLPAISPLRKEIQTANRTCHSPEHHPSPELPSRQNQPSGSPALLKIPLRKSAKVTIRKRTPDPNRLNIKNSVRRSTYEPENGPQSLELQVQFSETRPFLAVNIRSLPPEETEHKRSDGLKYQPQVDNLGTKTPSPQKPKKGDFPRVDLFRKKTASQRRWTLNYYWVFVAGSGTWIQSCQRLPSRSLERVSLRLLSSIGSSVSKTSRLYATPRGTGYHPHPVLSLPILLSPCLRLTHKPWNIYTLFSILFTYPRTLSLTTRQPEAAPFSPASSSPNPSTSHHAGAHPPNAQCGSRGHKAQCRLLPGTPISDNAVRHAVRRPPAPLVPRVLDRHAAPSRSAAETLGAVLGAACTGRPIHAALHAGRVGQGRVRGEATVSQPEI